MNIRYWPFTKIVLGFITGVLAVYYCKALHVGVVELLRFVGGALALWLPLAGWFYLLLRNEVPDRIVRIAFSVGGSYALTTLFYFAAATLNCNWLFYSVEAMAAAGLIYYAIKHRPAFESLLKHFRRFDWVLAVLIAASMVVSIPAQSVWRRDPETRAMIYDGSKDILYHIGQAYELSRHIPPQQAMIYGGFPERAYHHFMHLTTMLMARYSGQPDMLRAHLIYHYAVIQILMCLLLYSIGKTLSGSRIAGYCALALMYVAVAPNDFSHLSLGLDFVTLGSPQMYAGIVVLYTGLLGLLIVSERVYRGHQAPIVTLVTALVLEATIRFRIHIALAVLPGFLMVMLYLWRRTHQKVFLLAGFSVVVVGGLLYLEMRSPVYLQGTSNVRLGYSGLTESSWGPLFAYWPFAGPIHEWLRRAIRQPDVMKWVWEATCLAMFSLLAVIGIPLLAATSIYLTSQRARRVFAPFNFLVLWAVMASVVFSIVLSSTYDSISLGGQFPFHAHWYLFPLEGVALWTIGRFFQKRFSCPAAFWISLALIVLVVGLLYRRPAAAIVGFERVNPVVIRAEDWPAFVYLREHAPPDSVILTNRSWQPYSFIISGLSGRAAYLELPGNPIDQQARRLNPRDNRVEITKALRSAESDGEFCRLIRSTPITHVLEFQDHPWPVHPPDCLARLWENPERTVIIWQVIREVHS